MNRLFTCILMSLFSSLTYADYKLVWEDDFNTFDTNVWTHEIGTGDNGWGNFEQETYTDSPSNSYTDNSILNISALQIPNSNDRVQYTSARIKTQGNVSILYGKIEARMKLPKRGQGVWPAFWMLGESIAEKGWPYCGEIDIMEWKGAEPNTVISTSHWNGSEFDYNHCQYGSSLDLDFALDDDFYTYGVEWTPTFLDYYLIDNNGQRRRINIIDISVGTDANGISCFHRPAFILLNLAMGGQFGGDVAQDLGDRSFQIDWIRVYQDKETIPASLLINNTQSGLDNESSDNQIIRIYRNHNSAIVESKEDGYVDVYSYDGKLILSKSISAGSTTVLDIPYFTIFKFRK